MDKQARILIVDDDENIRNTMKAILEDEGYIVDLAASGNEAVLKLKNQPTMLHYWTFDYLTWKAQDC